LSLADLDRKLTELRTQLERAKKELVEAEAESQRRAARRLEIPQAVPKSRERLVNVESDLATLATLGDPEDVRLAKEALLLARRQAINSEISALEKELPAYNAQTELLRIQRDLAARRVTRLDQDFARLGDLVNDRRRKDARAQRDQAAADIKSVPNKALQEFEIDNLEFAKKRLALAEQIQAVSGEFGAIQKRLAELTDEFKGIQNQAKTDSSDTFGLSLRKKRAELPDESSARRDIERRQRTIQKVQFELFELEDQRTDLADVDAETQSELAKLALQRTALEESEIERSLRDLLLKRKQILDNLIDDTNHYFERLVDLNTEQQHLVGLVDQYTDFVDEHVLFVRSCATLSLVDAKHAARAAIWFLQPDSWLDLGKAAIADARKNPISVGLAVVALALLFYYRRRLRKHISDTATVASRTTCREFLPTVRALVLAVLTALPWPLLAWCIAWRMELYSNEFARTLASGLIVVAVSLLPLELFRQICRRRGLAEAHFGWSEGVLSILRPNLRVLILLGLPLIFVAGMFHQQENELYHNSLGRLCFIATMAILAVMLHRIFRLKGGVLQEVIAANRGGWLDRMRYVWYVAIVFVPVFFCRAGICRLLLHIVAANGAAPGDCLAAHRTADSGRCGLPWRTGHASKNRIPAGAGAPSRTRKYRRPKWRFKLAGHRRRGR
jgi:potassium efflux system protein